MLNLALTDKSRLGEGLGLSAEMSISLGPSEHGQPKKPWAWVAAAAVYGLLELTVGGPVAFLASKAPEAAFHPSSAVCPLSEPLIPSGGFRDSSQFLEEDYVKQSVDFLAGAIKIPTQSFDEMASDPLKDDRFNIFADLHQYLFDTFPLTAENVEKVNTYGLLYTVKGSSSSLKPLILMAHQDVVPVNPETVDQWEHPPFSGFYDGEWMYGRGTIDTKNTLIGILEATESLLGQGWQPERTILISFGFDEEVEGKRGAGKLSSHIEQRYGKNSIEAIVDEGSGVTESYGALFPLVSTAEKGLIDIKYSVEVQGGHSSMPPDHTGIGILADLILKLEADPFKPYLDSESVTAQTYSCFATAPEADDEIREIVAHLGDSKYLQKLIDILSADRATRFFIQTSQAVDVISGGVKINALPEHAFVKVDHRVSVDETVQSVWDRGLRHAKGIAQKYDLGLVESGKVVFDGMMGNLTIDVSDWTETAPKSPTSGKFWDILSGVNKHVFNSVLKYDLPVITAPLVMFGNTDTANYWNLTSSIYRYTPLQESDGANAHTVNEKIRFRGHLGTVIWYYEFLQFASTS